MKCSTRSRKWSVLNDPRSITLNYLRRRYGCLEPSGIVAPCKLASCRYALCRLTPSRRAPCSLAGMSSGRLLRLRWPQCWLSGAQRSEVLHQQPVDEDIPAANFAEENALGAVIEEGDEAEGERAVAGELPAQAVVLQNSEAAVSQR